MASKIRLVKSMLVTLTGHVKLVLIFQIFFKINHVSSFAEKNENVNGVYDKEYKLSINRDVQYIFEFKDNTQIYPARLSINSTNANRKHPLLVVAQHKEVVATWKVPLVGDIERPELDYNFFAHTLCPDGIHNFVNGSIWQKKGSTKKTDDVSNPSIVVTTSSPNNIDFTLKVQLVKDFFLKINEEKTAVISISEPVYYYYNFYDPEHDLRNNYGVIVMATSESSTCMIFSIQSHTCPILDMEDNIKYDSYWQSMSKKTSMVLTKEEFPHGFFVVMVMKPNDDECSSEPTFNQQRTKVVKLKVVPTISMKQHKITAYVTLGIFLIILLIIIIGSIIYFMITANKARNLDDFVVSVGIERYMPFNVKLCFIPCSVTYPKATIYVWLVIIVLFFYMLPVLQLVYTYQAIVGNTGNNNVCYYNFLCALPLRFVTVYVRDFNHVLSNIGYVFLGIAFIILTHTQSIWNAVVKKQGCGVKKPYGLFYALGIALIMEGLMSAAFHICPKKSNFQFDTCFMHIMGVLMLVNLYENRKSNEKETNMDRRGFVIFLLLAAITAISVTGTYLGTTTIFWILFTIIHIVVGLYIIWKIDKVFLKALSKKSGRKIMNHIDVVHIASIIVLIFLNFLLAIVGIVLRYKFATHILILIIMNGIFYSTFYIIMKMLHKEKMAIKTYVLFVLSIVFWVPAMYFFGAHITSWEKTPAQSRNLNKGCLLLDYYDSHDIWHFLSGFALFFTCYVLLTLDDGLNTVPTHTIVNFHNETRFIPHSMKSSNERTLMNTSTLEN